MLVSLSWHPHAGTFKLASSSHHPHAVILSTTVWMFGLGASRPTPSSPSHVVAVQWSSWSSVHLGHDVVVISPQIAAIPLQQLSSCLIAAFFTAGDGGRQCPHHDTMWRRTLLPLLLIGLVHCDTWITLSNKLNMPVEVHCLRQGAKKIRSFKKKTV